MSDTSIDPTRFRPLPLTLEPAVPSAPKPAPFAAAESATASLPPLGASSIAAARSQAFAVSLASKNDAYFAAANPTYELPDGTKAQAAAQFRMVGGYNYHSVLVTNKDGTKSRACTDGGPLLEALKPASKAVVNAVHHVVSGRGTPEEVRLVTQTLIDRGKLGAVDPKHPEQAIQAMQWKYGVGIDCAGFVQRAFFAARGKSGTASERAALGLAEHPANESFAGLPKNHHFKSVAPASARAGDVMLMGAPPGDTVGHVVLVGGNTELSAIESAKLGVPKDFSGPVRMIEVDSSWGAGEEGQGGGVQRRTFLYDQGTGRWASFDPATKKVRVTDGPYDHPLTGIYRPKNEP